VSKAKLDLAVLPRGAQLTVSNDYLAITSPDFSLNRSTARNVVLKDPTGSR
jgi:hypothetical protein